MPDSSRSPGRVGSARHGLLLRFAREPVVDYPDGIVAIGLSALVDANEVIPIVARALDTVASEKSDPVELVATQLNGLRLLLVLDNFEHLLSAAVDVGRLVSTRPQPSRSWSPAVPSCGFAGSASTPGGSAHPA